MSCLLRVVRELHIGEEFCSFTHGRFRALAGHVRLACQNPNAARHIYIALPELIFSSISRSPTRSENTATAILRQVVLKGARSHGYMREYLRLYVASAQIQLLLPTGPHIEKQKRKNKFTCISWTNHLKLITTLFFDLDKSLNFSLNY
jgi:hypothetical protein